VSKQLPIFFFCLLFQNFVFGQATQTVKGIVLDKQSQLPMIGVLLQLSVGEQMWQTRTDVQGKFFFKEIKPGRYDLKASYMGFKPAQLTNLLLTTGKELDLEIFIEERKK
jgi:hypothetical protein